MGDGEVREALIRHGVEFDEIDQGFVLTGGEDVALPNELLRVVVDRDAVITRPEVGFLSGYTPKHHVAIIDDLTTFKTPEDTRAEFGML